MEAASNKAIKSVESEYVAIHDDDDTWHSDFLKLAVEMLESTGEAGVVVRADKITERVSKEGREIEKLKQEQWMPDLRAVNLYRQCIDNQMTPITFLYLRNSLEKVGYYDESLPVLGDWDFGIRFLKAYDVEFLDPGYPLAYYHHRKYEAGSDTNNSFGDGTEKHRYWSNKLLNKYLREELSSGRLGVGYIMNELRYGRSNTALMLKRLMPGFVVERLKRRVQN
jgi:glycosyltransferase involved in cell wall biosynthesis